MITDKIKNLFKFIDFLYSNINQFKEYNEVMNEYYLLNQKQSSINPQNNFKDKIEYDKLELELNNMHSQIYKNITAKIKSKVLELNICDKELMNVKQCNYSEIRELIGNPNENDEHEILLNKSKYIEFRTETNYTYLLDLFFSDLDKILKILFVFFDERTEKEFNVFQAKTTIVNSIEQETKKPIQDKRKDLVKQELFNLQNNLIAKVSIEEVYTHFKVLITEPNSKGNFYLSEQKLLLFLKSTFIDQLPIKQDFNDSIYKIDVRSVFRKFQDHCFKFEYNQTNLKHKYFNIMFNAFNGFNEDNDFNKWHVTNNKLPIIKSLKAK